MPLYHSETLLSHCVIILIEVIIILSSVSSCVGMVSNVTSLHSRYFPSPYGNGDRCHWILKGPPDTGKFFSISATYFNLGIVVCSKHIYL